MGMGESPKKSSRIARNVDVKAELQSMKYFEPAAHGQKQKQAPPPHAQVPPYQRVACRIHLDPFHPGTPPRQPWRFAAIRGYSRMTRTELSRSRSKRSISASSRGSSGAFSGA